jgi:hypothetical protein
MQPPSPAPQRSWPRRLLNRLEVDRAVFYALATRSWQFLAGPVTIFLVALFFSAEVQGYFYTFASLMALSTLVELGLHTVIINVASHEWAGLEIDEDGQLRGDPPALSRLVSLGRRSLAWYAAASGLFVLGAGAAGWVFFRQQPSSGVAWEGAWFALVAVTGATLALLPLTAILEGCNQVGVVNRFRLIQAISGSIAVWAAMVLGAGLWTAVVAAGVRLIWELWLVGVTYGRFFRPFLAPAGADRITWRDEVWPLQWRMGARAATAYFAFSLFTPVMFHYHGPEAAGRMGMTWTALAALETAAFAWVQTRMPLFGMLIARRHFVDLDRIFLRLLAISFAVLVGGGAVLCGVVFAVNAVDHPLADRLAARLLQPWPTLVFTAGLVLLHVAKSIGVYIRSHKRDPFLIPGTLANLLVGGLVWLLGMRYGAIGAAWGYTGVIALLNVPWWIWLWLRCRREWHT